MQPSQSNRVDGLPRVVVGVDGGGTRTRVALVSAEDGRVLGIGEGGPGNIHDVGREGVRKGIDEARAEAWRASGETPRATEAAFLGLGSLVAGQDRALVLDLALELGLAPAEHIGIDHDLRVAWAGAHAGRPGIVLIAGTGSSCYGRDADGRSWRSGGWGSVLDDLGSSRELGRQAMVAAIRAEDGRGAATVLRERVLGALGLPDIGLLPQRADRDGFTRRELAALAGLVTEAAAAGDAVARGIVDAAADELAATVEAVVSKLGFGATQPVPLAATGGLISAGEVVVEPLRRAVRRRAPRCELVPMAMPPVLGAACLALELLAGRAPDPELVRRMVDGAQGVGS